MVTHTLSLPEADSESWLTQLESRFGPDKCVLIRQAFEYLQEHGDNLVSDSGAALISHSFGCGRQLSAMGFDTETIAAGLLCGLPESALQTDLLLPRFGPALTSLALGSLRLQRMDQFLAETQTEQSSQSEALRQMLLAMTDDIRVVLVKLADRAQALRELASGDETIRRKVAHDARELYAPLANRLGVWQLKWELEDLTCRYLDPDTYRQIAKHLDERRLDREWYIEQIIETLNKELTQAGLHDVVISGRPKHIASIVAKMRKKHLSFEEVYDVRAVRILVHDVKDCFHALGVIHSLWQPIPGQFDDYISRPKGNGYKSLHTAVIGPEHKALEVQIRTHDMHNEAELGVAAHWRYKEGGKGEAVQEKITWLRQLLAWKQELTDSDELSQHFRNELFQDEVFVLTPQGKVIALPAGATPLDFAYAVHTELGHRCRGAKVDGAMVSLDTAVKTGQRIEILTVKQGGPSRDWLNPHLGVLKTHRARSKVRQWFRQQDMDSHIQDGRAQLDKDMHRLGLSNVNLDKLASRLKFSRTDDLYAALGRGDLGPSQLERALLDEFVPPAPKPLIGKRKSKAAPSGVLVEGEANLLTQLARCCHPAPPDPIVGYTTQGRGVTIHRTDCSVILKLPTERKNRLLQAEWGNQSGQVFAVDVELIATDRQGLLKDITEILSQEKLNAVRVNTSSRDGRAYMEFTLEVGEISQLSRFLARIGQVKGMEEAWRK